MLRGKLVFMSTDNRHTEKNTVRTTKKTPKQAWVTQIIVTFVTITTDRGLSAVMLVDIHNMIT